MQEIVEIYVFSATLIFVGLLYGGNKKGNKNDMAKEATTDRNKDRGRERATLITDLQQPTNKKGTILRIIGIEGMIE